MRPSQGVTLLASLVSLLGCCCHASLTDFGLGHSAVGKQRLARHGHMHASGGGGRRPDAQQKGLVYVYDMPAAFTKGIVQRSMEWHSEQYDYDQVLHKHLLQSELRTTDPERAQLFFIPAYLGHHFNWFWQQWSTPGQPWEVVADCEPRSAVGSAECWMEKWRWAQENTSALVADALAHVRGSHPYWARKNGADHFMVFSFDHARCDLAPALSLGTLGRMFSIQSFGDLTALNVPEVPPLIQRWRENDYSWGGPRAWACFRPDADVLVPMYYGSAATDTVGPFERERPISLLMRFGYEAGDGKNLVEHYGHRLRYELIEAWQADALPGSQQGLRSSAETEDDMAHSVFCACPPGATQDTTRVFKAILKGCIPVTFFRANDLPFERFLGVPYEDFVLNIQPDDYAQLNERVAALLGAPARLRRMQEALQVYQRQFLWGADERGGVLDSIERELAIRAARLSEGVASVLS